MIWILYLCYSVDFGVLRQKRVDTAPQSVKRIEWMEFGVHMNFISCEFPIETHTV